LFDKFHGVNNPQANTKEGEKMFIQSVVLNIKGNQITLSGREFLDLRAELEGDALSAAIGDDNLDSLFGSDTADDDSDITPSEPSNPASPLFGG
jgi:hypothetical protein